MKKNFTISLSIVDNETHDRVSGTIGSHQINTLTNLYESLKTTLEYKQQAVQPRAEKWKLTRE